MYVEKHRFMDTNFRKTFSASRGHVMHSADKGNTTVAHISPYLLLSRNILEKHTDGCEIDI